MSNSSQTHLSDTVPPSMESKPSLLNRMNMESASPTPYSRNERMSMMMEIDDLKHLSGILPDPHSLSTSTISLEGYPRETSPQLGNDDPGDPDGSSSNESSNCSSNPNTHGRSNKKQRIYESQMPWYDNENRIRRSNTNPSCNKTRDILNIFQRDLATVKRWIRCTSSAPAGFPSTE